MLRGRAFLAFAVSLYLQAPFLYAQQPAVRDLTLGSTGRSLALVVGNDSYDGAPLINARNDARAMAVALRELGFVVTQIENASRAQMASAVSRFGDALRPGDVAWFFYAGHGAQIGGENFLIPSDFSGASESAIRLSSLPLSELRNAFSKARVSILVLDACRNNPFLGGRSGGAGLAPVEARGHLVAFSTASGETASDNGTSGNGLFTQELLKYLRGGRSIRDVFFQVRQGVFEASGGRQFPAVYDGLLGDFTLPSNPALTAATEKPTEPHVQEEAASKPESTVPSSPAAATPSPPPGKRGGGAKWLMIGGGGAAVAVAAAAAAGSGGAGAGTSPPPSTSTTTQSTTETTPTNRAPSIVGVRFYIGTLVGSPADILLATATEARFQIAAVDPDGDKLTATVNYGDGTNTSQLIDGDGGYVGFPIKIFNNAGSFQPVVTITDGRSTAVTRNFERVVVGTMTGTWVSSGSAFATTLIVTQNGNTVSGQYVTEFNSMTVTGTVGVEGGAYRRLVLSGSYPDTGTRLNFDLNGSSDLQTLTGWINSFSAVFTRR